jgi:hypothetical protein
LPVTELHRFAQLERCARTMHLSRIGADSGRDGGMNE